MRNIVFLVMLLVVVSISSANSESIKRGGVVLSFDDYYVDKWYDAHNMLTEYNWKATFFVSEYDTRIRIFPDTLLKLIALQDYGHEIGHHTTTHPRSVDYVNEYGIEAYLADEINNTKLLMEEDGFNVTSFAYPGTNRNKYIDSVLLHEFEFVRGGVKLGQPFYNNSHVLASIGIDNNQLPDSTLMSLMQQARDNDEVAIFYAHLPAESVDPNRAGDNYKITYQRLIQMCEFIVQNNMEFVTISDLPKWTTYPAALNVNKDGDAWKNHGKTFIMKNKGNEEIKKVMTAQSSGKAMAQVRNGVWKVYDETDTYMGVDITVDGAATNVALNYSTISYSIANDASGGLLAARVEGSQFVSGDLIVEDGKNVTLIAVPNDGYKFVNWTVADSEVSKNQAYTFVVDGAVTLIANFELQDNFDIVAAKTLIENVAYGSVMMSSVNTLAEARAYVDSVINDLNLEGVTATINSIDFTSAAAGRSDNIDGTNGNYTFTVSLNKGVGTQQVTNELTLTITAMPYDSAPQDNIDITAAKAFVENIEYGSVVMSNVNTFAQARAVVESVINNLYLGGVSTTINSIDFTPAIVGTVNNPDGTNGCYIFSVSLNKGVGTQQVTNELTLIIIATGHTSVVSFERIIPAVSDKDSAAMLPQQISSPVFELTAGPNPVLKANGSVKIFGEGSNVAKGSLVIYDATGNVVRKIDIREKASFRGHSGRREIGSWDLKDSKGRPVSTGTYLANGVIIIDGKREKVSLVIGIR